MPSPGLIIHEPAKASITAINVVVKTKNIVINPIRPADRVAPSEDEPETIETNTSGTTSIFINWIKSVPKGAKIEDESPISRPTTIPRIMAMNI